MSNDFDTEALVREFLEEAEDHFHTLDQDLLALETAIDGGARFDPGLIEEMFRATHTLKGLSAMFDLVDIKTLAHTIESVFDGLRSSSLTLDRPLLETLFESIDALREATMGVSEVGGASPVAARATSALRERLANHTESGHVVEAESNELEQLSELALERVEEGLVHGLRPVVIPLRWGIELRQGAFRREWFEDALGNGEILQVRPVVDGESGLADIDIDVADVVCEIVATTDRTDEELAATLGMRSKSIRTLRTPENPGEPSRTAPASQPTNGQAATRHSDYLRVDIARLDDLMDLAGELVTARTRLEQLTNTLRERQRKDETTLALAASVKEVSGMVNNLQERLMQLRMVPVGQLFSRFPRAVRDLAKNTGKQIRLVIVGEETELDKRVIEQIEDPLLHILRNACDHGIESPQERESAHKEPGGTIVLTASHEGNSIVIEVSDDGRGLDLETIRRMGVERGEIDTDAPDERVVDLIMHAGFTTSTEITDVSGRGVGLDVVARRISDLGGRIEVDSTSGKGTSFKLRLPLTLAIIPSLLVKCSNATFAVPLASVAEVLRIDAERLASVQGNPVLEQRGYTLPLAAVGTLLGMDTPTASRSDKRLVVEINGSGQKLGLLIDSLVGQREIVVKSLENVVGRARGIGGATILGDGSIVPILDCDELVSCAASAHAKAGKQENQEAIAHG